MLLPTLCALQVLWLSRCALPSLDGMGALPSLRELYAAFNDISELQPLQACGLLEVRGPQQLSLLGFASAGDRGPKP